MPIFWDAPTMTDTQTEDGPSDAVQEQRDDETFVNDRNVLLQVLRVELAGHVCKRGPVSDLRDAAWFIAQRLTAGNSRHYLEQFVEDYGVPQTLRALAVALEQGPEGL